MDKLNNQLKALREELKAVDAKEHETRRSAMSRRWFVRALTMTTAGIAVLGAQDAGAANCGGQSNSCTASLNSCTPSNTCSPNTCTTRNVCTSNTCKEANTCENKNACTTV